MVLIPEDSAGPTTLLKGRALETWRWCNQSWSLSDAFDMAKVRNGPRFTRQVVRGGRLDQSRLDRAYLSRGGSWMHKITCIHHEGDVAASDHIPVVISCKVEKQIPLSHGNWPGGKYGKLSRISVAKTGKSFLSCVQNKKS
ncbi:hypothetical protein R1sor_005613 [Riccia sorocarpa]|uniref:Endonuclease/exonuclease/phosphatase domain-containing protein n=1 Tax=Riccia sorocarpa TaxID=122646 RepID=A0ABD3HNL7_9MARC